MSAAVRSVVAVVLGFMAMIVLKMLFTLILVKTMTVNQAHPATLYLAVVVVCTFIAATLGGFVTGAVAKTKPVEHAAALGAIVFFLGWLSYQHYGSSQPIWYQWLVGVVPPFLVLTGSALSDPKSRGAQG
jgi:hypothetical protein